MLLFMPIALSVDAGAALRRVRRPLDRTGLVAAMEAVGTVGALLALAWLAVQLRFGGGVALFTPVLLWLALRRGVAATSFAAAFVAAGSALAVPTGAWPEVAGLTGAAATAVGFQTLLLILALPPLTVAVVVAERERARLEHARSAQRYALALDAAGSGFWEWDLAGGRIETDARWAAALGFAPGARRASLRDFEAGVDPDHRGGVAEILAGLEQGRGEFAGAEFRLALPGPEGAAVWVAMSGRVVERDASGRPLRALGTLGDITRRKDAEATLEAATRDNALYRAVVEALPDCLNVKDTEGRFLAANSATARLMGAASADDLLGRTDFDFYPPELAQSYCCDELSTIACGTTLVLEQETRSDEGACGWLCSLKAPFIDAGGNIVGLVTHNRDVTEQKRLQLKLERTKQQLDDAVASMADGFALFNADDRLVLCNKRCRQLFPKSAALRVPGIPLRLLMREAARLGEYAGVDETNAAGWIAARLALLDAGQRQEVELAGGRWIEPLSTRTVDGGRIVVYREVTERKRLEGELLAAKRRLDEALASMADALVLFDAHDRIVLCNQRYRELFPKSADLRVPGVRFHDLLRQAAARGEEIPPDSSAVEAWVSKRVSLLRTTGQREIELPGDRWIEARSRPTADGGAIAVLREVTERKRLERSFAHQALHDPLTGLANRALFHAELRRMRARAERDGTALAVLLVDLDRFKQVNDTHGHAVGDRLLVEVARRLQAVVREGDLVARLGGDEFAVLAPGRCATAAFGALAQRVVEELRKPIRDGKATLEPSASVGLTVFPDDTGDGEGLLLNADRALYAAKALGRNAWSAHRPSVDEPVAGAAQTAPALA
jgi:diguanylate cyclase (GGDEF)-like protein/PAS domain S-box-containing protein